MKNVVSFLREFAWPFGLILGAYGLVSPFIPDRAVVSVAFGGAACAVLLSVIVTQWSFIARQSQEARPQALRIEQVLDGGGLYLIQKNEVLGQNMAALIYLREGRYERLIGEGVVLTIQSDGRTQLRVSYAEGLEAALQLQIAQNADVAREKLVIRPGVLVRTSGGVA